MGYDKKLHFFAGFIISILTYELLDSIVSAFVASFLAGVAKEIYDRISYGCYDIQDLLATVAGGIAGIMIYIAWTAKHVLIHL